MKSEIKFSIDAISAPKNVDNMLRQYASQQTGIPFADIQDIKIITKSIDSRKERPLLVYKAVAELPDSYLACREPYQEKNPAFELPRDVWKHPDSPVIVGTGPAGLFAAYYLAAAGAKPLILDRGFPVEERVKRHEEFLKTRKLDTESNLLIGEGGAGTFSDGKLYTGTRSPFSRTVIEELIRCGAPEEIGYLARPHVGSDKLRTAVANLRKRIISMGGEFRFGCEVRNLIVKDGVCCGVELGSGEKISTGAGVIVACGLGGRELVRNIISSGAAYTMKNYQIGCRIEHPQEFIDCKQYHTMSRPEALGAAEYHMVSRPAKSLPVSTFCMCPGGTIVNASAWENHSITNGMSNFARDGKFANSCLIATTKFLPGTTPDRAYELISRMEKELFIRGGRDYAFPCQRADDFLRDNDTYSHNLESSCETGIVPGRINDMLTPQVRDGICAALTYFDRIMRGFIRRGNFVGVESCVSSPVRIDRGETGESNIRNFFPSGEGMGLAGGIISAACDGMRSAENLLKAVNK